MEEENDNAVLFFDRMPEEILNNVLRFFSRVPHSKKWEIYLGLPDILALFAVDGTLKSYMGTRFNTLCVSKTHGCFKENYYVEWKLRVGTHLWTNSTTHALAFVTAGGGKSLHTLIIGEGMYLKERLGNNLAHEFLRHCPNVVNLSIMEHGELSFVDKFGPNLKTLELMTNIPVQWSVGPSVLRELTLHTLSKQFSTTDFWRTIGGGLQKLIMLGNFPTDEDTIEEIGKIEQYCRNLDSIAIRGRNGNVRGAISDLLISYGEQLLQATIDQMNEAQLRDIINACPCAHFHLVDNGSGAPLIHSLDLVGVRTEVITTRGFITEEDCTEWASAWGKCTNLKELYLRWCVVGNLPLIFSTPKFFLTTFELTLHCDTEPEEVKKALNVCATGTKCVERFIYSGPALSRDNTHKFLLANSASLSSIIVKSSETVTGSKLDEFLYTLLILPKFDELIYNCEISEGTSQSLQRRGIYWKRSVY